MTHWKKLTNPNYLGAYALEEGQELVVTIDTVREEKVVGPDGKKEDCVVAHFKEGVKPMILNATNMKMITKIYKTPYIENWSGKKIQIYVDTVKAFGDTVEALRIRPRIPKGEEFKCADCTNAIKPAAGMTAEQIAQRSLNTYGETLCLECAMKRKNAKENAE